MQDQGEFGGGDALPFERLAQDDFVVFGLGLHAQFIAFEGNAGGDATCKLLLVIPGSVQRFGRRAPTTPALASSK